MGVECKESSSSSTVLGVESTGCWIDPDGLTNLAPGESAFICSLTGVTACPFVMTVMLLLGEDFVVELGAEPLILLRLGGVVLRRLLLGLTV